jgi:hypothetical protein
MTDLERAAAVVAAQINDDGSTYAEIWNEAISAAEAAIRALPQGIDRVARMQARLDDAEAIINAAVEIMTFEQVGQWAGVRRWLEQDESDYLQPPDEKRAAYAEANPLGGPARMFEAIAERIRAGEDYYAVLDDYGLQHKGADAKDAERYRWLRDRKNAVKSFDMFNENCDDVLDGLIDAAIAAAGKENGNA